MHPTLGFGVIAVLLLALSLVFLATRRRREARRQAMSKTRDAVRAANAEDTMMGPATLREAEDRIPTIDDHGNRHLVIRTRTLETVLGPIGPVEVERKRRLTLPGQGHVFAVSDTEFEIFHSRTRLRIDVAAPVGARSTIG
jgi:hypothetical protein